MGRDSLTHDPNAAHWVLVTHLVHDLVYDDHDLELDNLSTDLLDQARLTLDSRDEL